MSPLVLVDVPPHRFVYGWVERRPLEGLLSTQARCEAPSVYTKYYLLHRLGRMEKGLSKVCQCRQSVKGKVKVYRHILVQYITILVVHAAYIRI